MIFRETALDGVWLIEPEPLADERGFFARTWCRREWQARGLNPALVQCNTSWTRARGTVRGMHYQLPPHQEAKLVRCTRGAIHDVALDLRPDSSTLRRWVAADLSAENRRMLYVPEGVAHGFQTLADDTEVFYQMSEFHHPESARGVRWDDPACAISWPLAVTVSPRDAAWPRLRA
jgi:dTDP-4-dehydrorhamnose 3,5-epimerase